MSNELKKSQRHLKRSDGNYHNKSSIVMRVVRFEKPGGGDTYTAKFINPFIPIAILKFDTENYPVAGITGIDPENSENVITITEGFGGVETGFEIFGIDPTELLTDLPSLINFYCTLKSSEIDLEYTKLLAELLPDECWIEPKTITVDDVDAVNILDAEVYRLLILEKR